MDAEISDALVDGTVTYDEYRDGYERFASCMRAEGYPLSDETEQRSIMSYAIPAEAVDSGIDMECYERTFEPLDIAWQTSHEDESETAEVMRTCLRQEGFVPAETVREMYTQMTENDINFAKCVGGE